MPGIGKILGITSMLETGDINRFPEVSDYSSYCRCVSSQKIPNGKEKGERNKNNGNTYLAWMYGETANPSTSLRTCFMRR
ncbi:MAG: transposase [Planctomycetia bacterium]|nr:transposase [Candidatus Brocadia sp.]QOJ05728.1 MAG: transposase [Planctomycetia bacterium]